MAGNCWCLEGGGWEGSGVVSPRSSLHIDFAEFGSSNVVASDERVSVLTVECIDVLHHPCTSVNDGEEVAEQFLAPATDNSDVAVILQYFLDGRAVAECEEVSSPEVLAAFLDAPAQGRDLTHETVKGLFVVFAGSGTEPDGPKAWARQGFVEIAFAGHNQFSRGATGSW